MRRISTRIRFRWGIASILTGCVVVSVAVLMTTTTLLDIRRERAFSLAQLEERGVLSARTLNDVLADPLYFRDLDELGDIASVVSRQQDIEYVQVFDPGGRLLIDTGQEGRYAVGVMANESALVAVNRGETVVNRTPAALEVAAPILAGGEVLGGVRVGLSTTALNAKISEITVQRLWQSVAIIAIGVVISYSAAQYLVRPIRRLVAATQRVSEGVFDYEVSHRRSDEIGDLAVSFETMTRALRESRASLEQRTAELSAAYKQLVVEAAEREQLEEQLLQAQKMESMGRLAGGVAHDFNNLLTPILGYAELGLRSVSPEDEAVHTSLTEIEKAAERASHVSRQMLAFSRHQIIDPRVVSLSHLIMEVDRLLRRLVSEDIELVTLPAPDLWSVEVDPGQFEQVLVNLVVNARDAMPDGGHLRIETENVTLDDEYTSRRPEVVAGDYVMVALTDTGVGMTEDVIHRIFEPFFTTKEVGRGTGLGLSTCYGIVAQSGGHIAVDSAPGRGTTFKVYLPRSMEAAVVRAPHREPDDLPVGTETVLAVEDEPSVLEYAARVLRQQGYKVLEAANGEEALSVAREHADEEIHLLLTDIVMPLMGGRELAERIRDEHPETRVLLTSGYTGETTGNRGLLDSDAAFMEKPFTPTMLARKVREVLEAT